MICELCWATGREPGPLAILMLVYAFVMLAGQGVYGVEAWSRRGDAFGVWFGLFAMLAPFAGARTARGAAPAGRGGDAARARRRHGRAARDRDRLDGVRRRQGGPAVQRRAAGACRTSSPRSARRWASGSSSPSWSACWSRSALVGGLWFLGTLGMPRAGADGLGRVALSRAFAHTLIPIAAAYVVAHYFSLLAYNGQDLWRLASDPLGDGSDLFGGAGGSIDYSILSATAIWYVQVLALVAATSPRSCSPTTARSSSTARRRRRPARRSSCWC